MKGYSEREVFTDCEMSLLRQAEALVAKLPHEILGEEVRCHELARAVGAVLDLEVADGHFGVVEHSWLWTKRPRGYPWGLPNILDVYALGAMPQVQLIHAGHPGLPQRYSPRGIRDLVIRDSVIERLTPMMIAPHPRFR